MVTTPVPTWWEENHASLCEIDEDPSELWADAGPPFSDALLQLLAAVEDAFAAAGADTAGWADPHVGPDGEDRDSLEEEYSRCLDPGKYRILWARAEAWMQILTARGWAERDEIGSGDRLTWLIPPRVAPHRTTVLHPRRPGALSLVLARTAPDDISGSTDLSGAEALLPGLVLGIGDPALEVETLPDCGCDACDSGSRDLLEQLDRLLLSIVDGSFEITVTPTWRTQRSSFSSGGGSDGALVSAQVTAGPWADGWTPRPLSQAIAEVDPGPLDR